MRAAPSGPLREPSHVLCGPAIETPGLSKSTLGVLPVIVSEGAPIASVPSAGLASTPHICSGAGMGCEDPLDPHPPGCPYYGYQTHCSSLALCTQRYPTISSGSWRRRGVLFHLSSVTLPVRADRASGPPLRAGVAHPGCGRSCRRWGEDPGLFHRYPTALYRRKLGLVRRRAPTPLESG